MACHGSTVVVGEAHRAGEFGRNGSGQPRPGGWPVREMIYRDLPKCQSLNVAQWSPHDR
jgi:hypothetical protein